MNIIELSKYILHEYSQKSSDGIKPMKLQKLLFYIKAWTLVSGSSIIAESFEHWDYGPVNRDVYDYYKQNGSKTLEADEYTTLKLSESEKELVNFIVENYISFDAITLSTMTHQEDPWKKTSRNEIITDELIKEYYGEQRFAKNFEDFLDLSNKPFYTLKNYG